MKRLLYTVLAVTVLLSGCNSSSLTNTTVYDLENAYNQVYSGSTYNLSGTDNSGNQYTASVKFVDRGQTTYNNQTVTQIDELVAITQTSTNGTTHGSSSTYYEPNWSPYAEKDNVSGVTYIPQTHWTPPSSGQIGDSGNLPKYIGNDGSQETGTWQLNAGAYGNAVLTFDTTNSNGGQIQWQGADSLTVTPAGNVPSLKVVIHYSSGEVLTLSGPKQ